MAIHNYKYRIDISVESETDFEHISARIFVVIFSLEFLMKVIAMGFVLQQHSYLRNAWNVIDFISLLSGIFEVSNFASGDILWLRTLRVIKPLRSIKMFP